VLGDEEIARLKEENGVDHVINKPLPDFDALGVVLHDIIKKKQESLTKQVETTGTPQESASGGSQQETASGRAE
jgi:hypothetical protein